MVDVAAVFPLGKDHQGKEGVVFGLKRRDASV